MKISALKKANKDLLIKKAPRLVSWGAVGASLLLASWITFEMVQFTLEAKLADPGAKPPLPILVNLENYDSVATRIEKSKKLTPVKIKLDNDPFKAPTREALDN